MAVLDPIRAQVLATRLIPSIERPFAERLGLTDDERSLALVTCDIDDVLYQLLLIRGRLVRATAALCR